MRARRVCEWIAQRVIPQRREADFVIGGTENPYLLRWFIIPRNRFFNIYLHEIRRSDDDRALHDHPWASMSFCLRGSMQELNRSGDRVICEGDVIFRSARFAHRLVIHGATCWTLFVTGPIVRQWGFHCPKGWRHWKEFVSMSDPGQAGPGCE
jgi:hypothetical protein